MNAKPSPSASQARVDQFLQSVAQCPELSELASQDLAQLLQEGFSKLLNLTLQKERQFYLNDHPQDRANGYAPPRTLHVGATPVQMERPRTREGFYPALLPKHQRQLPNQYQELLQNVLLGARSFSAARRTLQAMGLPYSCEQFNELLQELHEEAKSFFNRPLGPDWLCLYADAKIVELKDEQNHVKKAVHFLVIGLALNGQKEILTAATFWGSEVLEAWRKVLVDLKNRGLVRVLQFITDDFSGLAPLLQGLFPNTDHQLCSVHLLRNAQRHLSPEQYSRFRQTWRELYAASGFESALAKLRQLLDQLRPANKHFVEHLDKRAACYLHFTKYPIALRPYLRSTNLPEGLNNQIENLRRNAGGHFHSDREALVKMKLLADQLYETKWHKIPPPLKAHLAAINQCFQQHFETELNKESFLTQNF